MSKLPYPISDDWSQARFQIEDLLRTLFEERIGGLNTSSSLEKSNDQLRLFLGAANYHLLMNAGATSPEYAVPYKISTFTRDMEAASGDVSYTGIGFKPSVILFIASTSGNTSISVGFDSGVHTYQAYAYGSSATYAANATRTVAIVEDVSKYQGAIVKLMDADGFTLTWTRTGATSAGTGIVNYLALR